MTLKARLAVLALVLGVLFLAGSALGIFKTPLETTAALGNCFDQTCPVSTSDQTESCWDRAMNDELSAFYPILDGVFGTNTCANH